MNNYANIGKDIFVIDKYFKLHFKTELKKYSLNTAEGMVLLALYEGDMKTEGEIFLSIHKCNMGMTQEQIIDVIHYDKGVMARTMQSLENKGYVIRNQNPQDSRSFIFSLTSNAKEFKPTLINILKDWTIKLLSGIDNIDYIKDALSKMKDNIMK
ncbi:MAG: MarR family winged helix-turn-helix transcriptional regulator [Clostridium sp.]|uniref:MarR family winged helix-turn-helix transcriptional regulator n=1 Tax=Clostridium sp. TaxID=1506 RepID=UPI002FCA48A3